jgi:hypothetical protein
VLDLGFGEVLTPVSDERGRREVIIEPMEPTTSRMGPGAGRAPKGDWRVDIVCDVDVEEVELDSESIELAFECSVPVIPPFSVPHVPWSSTFFSNSLSPSCVTLCS